jgi:pimeloyl-ACP methyl ester carboxylesterase
MKNLRLRSNAAIVLAVLLFLVACGNEPAPTPLPGCEDAPRPIVFVHGLMGGGDQFANAVMRFAANSYCPEYLRAFDWNTLSFDITGNTESLAIFIDEVLLETGAEQVDLVGHSLGGWLSYSYLADEKQANKVAHYVHAASFCDLGSSESIPLLSLLGGGEIAFPESVPVLVLSSDEDTVVGPCTLENAENQDVDGADHLQMVTLPQVFVALYRFFNEGQNPETTELVPEETVTLAGKTLTFGTNQSLTEAMVEIYHVDAATGERLKTQPEARFSMGDNGAWGPFQADPTANYEFLVYEEGERPFHYYRQPFQRSNPLVYLRALAEDDFLMNRILGEIRYDDRGSIVVLFSANQALYLGRDTATLDGTDLVTLEMAPPPPDSASTIAIFILDADGDGQTDGGPVPGPLAEFPFLQQYDAFLDAKERRTVTLTLNDATLNMPTWKADSEGVVIAVFD